MSQNKTGVKLNFLVLIIKLFYITWSLNILQKRDPLSNFFIHYLLIFSLYENTLSVFFLHQYERLSTVCGSIKNKYNNTL